VKEPPAGDEWLHEIKLDGYRIGCALRSGQVRLLSRRNLDWTAEFPSIANFGVPERGFPYASVVEIQAFKLA
jgi:bifunctional non-homologous end joining protein LigD